MGITKSNIIKKVFAGYTMTKTADHSFCDSVFLSPVTDEDTVKRYYAKFEERFFQTCEKELLKINTFYSGIYLLLLHLRK